MGWFSIGAAALGLLGSSRTNKANASINDANIAFQKEAAKNAHQWEVDDLRKAGLNPILSAGGSGAKVGSVSMIPAQNEIEAGVNSAVTASAARDAHKQNKEILKGLQNDTRVKEANADKARAEADNYKLLSDYPMPVYDNNGNPVVTYGEDGIPNFEFENRNLIAENMAQSIANNAIQNKILQEELKTRKYDNVYKMLEARAYSSPYGSILYGIDKGLNYLGQGAQIYYGIRSGMKPPAQNYHYTTHNENGTNRFVHVNNFGGKNE